MVAVIHTSRSLRAVLHYNENKVEASQAECLSAINYPKEVDELSFKQKLNFLERHASMNQRAKVNCVHVSLNFDPSERLSTEQLKSIADRYMEGIGFDRQPYMVYQHHDAGHPHLHIATTNIRINGDRIPLHNLGKNASERTRKKIEIDFNLVKSADKKHQLLQIKPVAAMAHYGKVETRKAIASVLLTVLDQYKFTSIPELNAVLGRYNIQADRGREDSRTYQKGGLYYRVLDQDKKPIGVPLKASDFYFKPTLPNLQHKFQENEQAREPYKARVRSTIKVALLGRSDMNLKALEEAVGKHGISIIQRRNDTGLLYGITYVDNKTRCVFNGSSLGKDFSPKGVQELLAASAQANQSQSMPEKSQQIFQNGERNQLSDNLESSQGRTSQHAQSAEHSLSDALFDPTKSGDYLPGELRKTKKKKQMGLSR